MFDLPFMLYRGDDLQHPKNQLTVNTYQELADALAHGWRALNPAEAQEALKEWEERKERRAAKLAAPKPKARPKKED